MWRRVKQRLSNWDVCQIWMTCAEVSQEKTSEETDKNLKGPTQDPSVLISELTNAEI